MKSSSFSCALAIAAIAFWTSLPEEIGALDDPWDVSIQCSHVLWTNAEEGDQIDRVDNPSQIYYMVGVDYMVYINLLYIGCESSVCGNIHTLCQMEYCPSCRPFNGLSSTLGLVALFKDKARGQFNKNWIQYSFANLLPGHPEKGFFYGYVKFLGGIKPSLDLSDAINLRITAGDGELSTTVTVRVEAGPVDAAHCKGEWVSKQNFQSHGTRAEFRVLLKDAYDNIISDKTVIQRDYSKLLVAKILRSPTSQTSQSSTLISMSCGKCTGSSCVEPCLGWLKIEWKPLETVTDQWLWIAVAGSPPKPINGSPFYYTLTPVSCPRSLISSRDLPQCPPWHRRGLHSSALWTSEPDGGREHQATRLPGYTKGRLQRSGLDISTLFRSDLPTSTHTRRSCSRGFLPRHRLCITYYILIMGLDGAS